MVYHLNGASGTYPIRDLPLHPLPTAQTWLLRWGREPVVPPRATTTEVAPVPIAMIWRRQKEYSNPELAPTNGIDYISLDSVATNLSGPKRNRGVFCRRRGQRGLARGAASLDSRAPSGALPSRAQPDLHPAPSRFIQHTHGSSHTEPLFLVSQRGLSPLSSSIPCVFPSQPPVDLQDTPVRAVVRPVFVVCWEESGLTSESEFDTGN